MAAGQCDTFFFCFLREAQTQVGQGDLAPVAAETVQQGTESVVRVLIESGDKTNHWNTVGVSSNILEASWMALVDSMDFKLYKDQVKG